MAPVGGAASSRPSVISTAQGPLSETGNFLDLALAGEGYFELRTETGPVFTRNGQFTRADDGRLLGAGGWPVQGLGGGDLVIASDTFSVTADGTVRDGDQVIARLAVVAFDAEKAVIGPDGTFSAAAEDRRDLDAPIIRQGFLEGSNVSLGDEMIALMEAVRRAETGQRLMNVYDDLMGRAITTFGQASA